MSEHGHFERIIRPGDFGMAAFAHVFLVKKQRFAELIAANEDFLLVVYYVIEILIS